MDKWSVIIPAYNEEKRIGNTVKALQSIPIIDQILVVNDGSMDNTRRVAIQAGAEVKNLKKNMGKGAALNEGIKYISQDFVAFIDADLEEKAIEVLKLFNPIKNNFADLTIAIFPQKTSKSGLGLTKGFSKWGINFLTGQLMQEPLSGQRAMRKEILKILSPFSSRFGVEVGMTIDAARQGLRILEIPTLMGHAYTGKDLHGFYHRGKQLKDISWTMFNRSIRRNY